jgi:hypothetical protein
MGVDGRLDAIGTMFEDEMPDHTAGTDADGVRPSSARLPSDASERADGIVAPDLSTSRAARGARAGMQELQGDR